MALDFTVRDVIHKIIAKFAPAYLPDAKKPYNLRAVLQPELDIHGIDRRDGLIAEALDGKTGQLDEVMTLGGLLTIRGYGLKVVTQSSVKHGNTLLKNLREVRSEFRLTVQNQ
ncbi:MAG: hypothetical protein LBP80_07315 [Treponema sp.]|jgi:hypothetical protein|nr:hypothetical protein [Treponema sp.]